MVVKSDTARINPCPTALPASLAKGGGTAKAVTEGLDKTEEVNYFESPLSPCDIPPLQGDGKNDACFPTMRMKITHRNMNLRNFHGDF